MKVVVTGGAGFIGSRVCSALDRLDKIDQIVAIDTLLTGCRSNLHTTKKVQFRLADVRDSDALTHHLRNARCVVHLAALPSVSRSIYDPRSTHDTNVNGTLSVLQAVRHNAVPHVIVASSSSVYGGNSALPKHEDLVPMPRNPYASSKLAAESYALSFAASFPLRVLALRFFNVFGPLQRADHTYAAVIPVFIDRPLRGHPLPINGDGRQTRDFTFVGDVAEILARAVVGSCSSNGPVNLAFGTRRSVNDLIRTLEAHVGHPLEREYRSARVGDVRHSQADGSRLRALSPDVIPTDFASGLARTLEWLPQDLATRKEPEAIRDGVGELSR